MKRVRLNRALVTANGGVKLNEKGEATLGKIGSNVVVIGGKEEKISPVFAAFYNFHKALLLSEIGVSFDEGQKLPFADFCRKFLELGLFEEFVPENKPVVHGNEAAVVLAERKELPLETELSVKQVEIGEKTLEEIDVILVRLSNGLGALRAAIVEIGNVPKNAGVKEIVKSCKLTRFLVEGKNSEGIKLVEARTLVVQCFNFQHAVVAMNKGTVEGFGLDKKNKVKKAVLMAEAEDKRLTFMLELKNPRFVFLLETCGALPGLVLLDLEKAVADILRKL